jgi:hypothetical protein
MSPFEVHLLDLDSGQMSCLAKDPRFDFLWPRIDADGTLYYIRRPCAQAPQTVDPWAALLRVLAVPIGILFMIGWLIDLLVLRATGQSLFPARNNAPKAVKTASSWLLMRQESGREAETIADSALSFDLSADGSVVYSNGIDVYRAPSNGGPAAKVMSGTGIDLIAAL